MARRWLLAGLCMALGAPGAAQPLTEAQAVARMRAEHPPVIALRFGVREFQADARARSLPANPAVAYTREEAGAAVDDFLLVSQELPPWGRRGVLREAAGHAVAARAADADAQLLAVETALRLVFTDLLLAQERVRSIEAGVGRLDALIDVLRTREEQGEGSRFDRLRAEREAAEADADLALARIDRRRAQAGLAAFFAEGTDPDALAAAGRLDDYRVPRAPAPASGRGSPSPARTIASAPASAPAAERFADRTGPASAPAAERLADRILPAPADPAPPPASGRGPEGRADYRALGLEAERWRAEERAARRLRLPSVQVTGGLKRSGVRGPMDTGFVVGASLSVPLFNRGQAQAARAAAARARVEAERRGLAVRIAAEVHAASASAADARALAARYRDDAAARAAELVAIAAAAYEEGEFGILELLDAHRVSLRANLRSLDLWASARRAAVELDRAAGREMTP